MLWSHPVCPWSLLVLTTTKKMHIVINRSMCPEHELSTVILKTASAPAHEIEIDLKIGVSFLMKLIFYETILFEVLLTKTKEIYCIHSTKATPLIIMWCHTIGSLSCYKKCIFQYHFWILLYFFKSERGYQFQQIV